MGNSSLNGNLTVAGVVTQNTAATLPAHLLPLGQAQTLLASLFQGVWNSGTAYTAGQMVTRSGGGLYVANVNNTGYDPLSNPTQWSLLVAAGASGLSAYVYVGYASDSAGTNFSLTPSSSLTYMAVLTTTSPLSPPVASNFAGLWVQTQITGATGAAGAAGSAGAAAYVYVGYASDTSGTGFSTSPASGLNYIAFLVSSTPIGSPTAGNFTGLWHLYGAAALSFSAPLVNTAGTITINASSANTVNYVVQRDGSGNFSANQAALNTLLLGGVASLNYQTGLSPGPSSAAVLNSPLVANEVVVASFELRPTSGGNIQLYSNVPGSVGEAWHTLGTIFVVTGGLRLNALSGVLLADGSGNVSGSAVTDNLPESGSPTNLWFTVNRVLASTLTGLSTATTTPVAATDTLLVALGKLQGQLNTLIAAAANSASGTVAIASATASGQVTGLALPFTPTKVQLTMQVPSGGNGQNLFIVQVGAVTTDGFSWQLSAPTPDNTYSFHYLITP